MPIDTGRHGMREARRERRLWALLRGAGALGVALAATAACGDDGGSAGAGQAGAGAGGWRPIDAGGNGGTAASGGAPSGGSDSGLGGAAGVAAVGGAPAGGTGGDGGSGGTPPPPPPPPVPSSFHFFDPASPPHWDSILALSNAYPNVLFVAHDKPAVIGADRWCAHRSYKSSPPTAEEIHQLLSSPTDAPRFVMIDELHDSVSEAYLIGLADTLRTQYPQWAGRWGAFMTYGNYPILVGGVDALLQANAVFALQLYPKQSDYCASGTNGGQRDIWLSEQFQGNASFGRLKWLMARRAYLNSNSAVTPLFGVGDVLLDGQSPSFFLDRMFYVWVTRTDYPGMISIANGGPGAYTWTPVSQTPLEYGVGNTSRDLAFAESVQHYSVAGLVTSRLGPVPCP